MAIDSYSHSIQKTLAYFSIFKYPVSFYQLATYLITNKKFKSKEFKKALKKLISKGFIKERNGYYFLPGIKNVDTEKRRKYTQKLIKKNRRILNILKKVPWVKMICITGSAANYNSEPRSDLDLLFVTAKNRLWLTRGFVFTILRMFGKLPVGNFEDRELCPNIFVDEKSLTWPKGKRDVYVAQNIISMQPIYQKDNMCFRFLRANSWIHKYNSQFEFYTPARFKKTKSSRSDILNFLEDLAYKMQLGYMKKRRTTEIVTKRLIHFNKNDNSQRILSAYKSVLKNRKI